MIKQHEINMKNGNSSDINSEINIPTTRDDTPVVAVLGTGRYGRALTARLRNVGYDVRVGSRTPDEDQFMSIDAVSDASIIFLCVPPFAHDSLIASIQSNLQPAALLVDISNHGLAAPPRNGDPSIAERLAKVVPGNVTVAKAMNTLAAEVLEKDPLPTVVLPPARIACDDRRAAKRLCEVMTDITLAPVVVGPLVRARELERLSHKQFPYWNAPAYVSLVVFIFWIVYYCLFKYVGIVPSSGAPNDDSAKRLPLEMFIHVMAETAMTLFALTFLAGPIATILQLIRGNGSKPYASWLTTWLNSRKELGLIALGFMVAHGIGALADVPESPSELDTNLFYMFGYLSFTAFLVMSVSSFPSVSAGLSWREARAVFSWLGLLAYVMGAAHQVIYAAYIFKEGPSNYPRIGKMPLLQTGWLGFIIVALSLLLRVVVWSPCVVPFVRRLHWDRRYNTML